MNIVVLEIGELNRQLKLTKTYSNNIFESEIISVQKQNVNLLSRLKGSLAIKSASILAAINNELNEITNTFFKKKFQTLS